MRLDPRDVRFDASDLGLQRFDPLVQLLDRHGVEVLLGERNQWVVGFAREEFVEVHAGIVDRCRRQVNKRASWPASLP